jgi:hypothetical protein
MLVIPNNEDFVELDQEEMAYHELIEEQEDLSGA